MTLLKSLPRSGEIIAIAGRFTQQVVPFFVTRDCLVAPAVLPLSGPDEDASPNQVELAAAVTSSGAVAIEHAQLYAEARELGVADERNRLAREVHDTVAQDLTAITLRLQSARRLLPHAVDAEEQIVQAHALAHRALEEARRAVWGLRAAAVEGRYLGEALAEEVAEFGRRTGLQASVVRRGEEAGLDEERAGALLRVTQEALHNVEKHARARRVRVQLEVDAAPGHVTLTTADDGRGFDVGEPAQTPLGGFGLISIRERMYAAGGELQVDTAAGWGTRIRARLPVAAPDSAHTPAPGGPTTPEPSPVRVVLVDDHPLAREGVRRLLEARQDVVVVGEAGNGVEGIERSLALRPDVRVLMLTTFAHDEHLVRRCGPARAGTCSRARAPTSSPRRFRRCTRAARWLPRRSRRGWSIGSARWLSASICRSRSPSASSRCCA
jgi:signal transduction histidine kinase